MPRPLSSKQNNLKGFSSSSIPHRISCLSLPSPTFFALLTHAETKNTPTPLPANQSLSQTCDAKITLFEAMDPALGSLGYMSQSISFFT